MSIYLQMSLLICIFVYKHKNRKTMARIKLLNGDVLYTEESAKDIATMLGLPMTKARGYIVVTLNVKSVYIMVSAIVSFM